MGNCWQLSNNWEGMVETLATLGYNGQLLATQQQLGGDGGDSGNTGLQRATAGNSATNRSDSGDSGNPELQRATAGNSATTGGDGGDSGNTWLQRATAGNSATPVRGWWRHWQHWATTDNCWQLSNK